MRVFRMPVALSDPMRDLLIVAATAVIAVFSYMQYMKEGGLLYIPEGTFSASALTRAEKYSAFPVMSTDPWAASVCASLGTCDDGAIRHFTLATNYRQPLDILLHSASMFGGGVDVVGLGDTRFKRWGEGFGVKVEMLHKYAAAQPPDQVILFTDAFDVVIAGTHEEMLAGYKKAMERASQRVPADSSFAGRKPAILFSAELFPTPSEDVVPLYPLHDQRNVFAFLNSGGIMCPAGELVKLMNANPYDVATVVNDQFYFVDAFFTSQRNASLPWVVLDHENDVFISMAGVDYKKEMQIEPHSRRWKHARTAGLPTVIHFQGYYGLKKGFPLIYAHIRGELCEAPWFTVWGVLLGACVALLIPLLARLADFPKEATIQRLRHYLAYATASCRRPRRDPQTIV